MNKIIEEGIKDFDWESYEADQSKGLNKKIQAKYEDAKVYCKLDYAMDLYEMMLDYPVKVKDVNNGEIVQIVSIIPEKEFHVSITTFNGLNLSIDLEKEKRFCSLYNSTPQKLWEILHDEKNQRFLISDNIYIELNNTNKGVSGSLSKARDHKIKLEFIKQIENPTTAYHAKVVQKNKGGFFVNVQGIDAFLPGGLAAANKIEDFNSYIGKEIPVMIEDYLQDSNTFIVSNKKYLNHIMPDMIKNLQLNKEYRGTVTGTTKFGIFIEFEEIFTGLIHVSKMSEETKEKFKQRKIKAGDEMNFFIKEITKSNKIILSEEMHVDKEIELANFSKKNMDTVQEAKVISNKPFGTLVKIEKDIIGLLSKKELKTKNAASLEIGSTVSVKIKNIKKDKLYLTLESLVEQD